LAILYGLGIFWGLPSALSAASDSTAPLGPLSFVADYRDPNKSYIYPAVHQLLLVSVYAVILVGCKLFGYLGSLSSSWPYGFSDPTTVFSAFILGSNLVSLVMGIFMLLLLKRIRPTKSYVPLVPMLLIGTSGVFAYYARVANLDVPYLFWWMLSFVFLWRFLFSGEPRRKFLMLSATAAALAIGTKDQSAGLILGFGLVVMFIQPPGANDVGWLGRFKNTIIFSVTLIAVYGRC